MFKFIPGEYHFTVFNSNDITRLKEVERYGQYCASEQEVYDRADGLIKAAQKAGTADAYAFVKVSLQLYTINNWPTK